jgi:hypothetical protein
MKLTTMALAGALALAGTFALAQGGGGGVAGGGSAGGVNNRLHSNRLGDNGDHDRLHHEWSSDRKPAGLDHGHGYRR